jgi:hypothetical protein
MRHDASFTSQGLRLSAWLYVPDNLAPGRRAPAIAMGHGFSCVKEQGLDRFARRFAEAGFVVLAFDYRFFGQSQGRPRGQLFPLEQIEDYRNAVSWLCAQPQVDPERIAAWGTSFSGGLVLHLAAFDRRIKAVAAQVPSVLTCDHFRAMDPDQDDAYARFLLQDRAARYATGAVNYLNVVAGLGEPCVLSGAECREAFLALGDSAPSWLNAVTVESLEKIQEFDPARFIHRIAPTPLLVIAAEHDSLIPAELVARAFERAGQPKRMLMLPCRHFDVYGLEPWFSLAADAAADWFVRHVSGN